MDFIERQVRYLPEQTREPLKDTKDDGQEVGDKE